LTSERKTVKGALACGEDEDNNWVEVFSREGGRKGCLCTGVSGARNVSSGGLTPVRGLPHWTIKISRAIRYWEKGGIKSSWHGSDYGQA